MATRNSRARYPVGVVSLFVVLLWVSLAVWAALPALIGWRPVAIVSGSMGPAIRRGDVVVVAPHDGAPLGPGSVITFQDPAGSGHVTHRVVGLDSSGFYLTKGDGNSVADSTPIDPGTVVGVGRLLVPVIGLPVVWASEEAWIPLFAWAILMTVALWCSQWAFMRPVSRLGRHGRFRPWMALGTIGRRQNHPKAVRSAVVLAVAVVAATAIPAFAVFSEPTSNSGNSLTAAPSFGGPTMYFLHNLPTPPVGSTASHVVLPLNEISPAASTLFNYDTDRDAFAGLLIAKGGSHGSGGDPTKEQVWDIVVGADTDLNGTATLILWSAIKDFNNSEGAAVSARLYDCTGAGTGCSTIDTASVAATPWSPTGSWTQRTIDFGAINHTITAGRMLRLEIIVVDTSGDDLWFAYDTTTYTARLHITG